MQGIDYASFFKASGLKADILIVTDIHFLLRDVNMDRFVASIEVFRKANPVSAVIVDASTSPLFKRLTQLWEQGKLNAIVDSPPGGQKSVALGIEMLSMLR